MNTLSLLQKKPDCSISDRTAFFSSRLQSELPYDAGMLHVERIEPVMPDFWEEQVTLELGKLTHIYIDFLPVEVRSSPRILSLVPDSSNAFSQSDCGRLHQCFLRSGTSYCAHDK